MPRFSRSLPILAALAAWACKGGNSDRVPRADAADAGRAAGSPATRASAEPRACRLLSLEEVEKVTGLRLVPGPQAPDYPWYSRCEWAITAGRTDGVVLVVNQQGKFSDYSTVPGSTPVSGFGREAIWNPGVQQLAVRRDTGTVSVSFVAPAQKKWAEALMHTVLSRLDGNAPNSTPTP